MKSALANNNPSSTALAPAGKPGSRPTSASPAVGRTNSKVTINTTPLVQTLVQGSMSSNQTKIVPPSASNPPVQKRSILRPQSAANPQTQRSTSDIERDGLKSQNSTNNLSQGDATSLNDTQKPLMRSFLVGEIPEKDQNEAPVSEASLAPLTTKGAADPLNENSATTNADAATAQPDEMPEQPETTTVTSGTGQEIYFVQFNNEKELRDHQSIQLKAAMFSGIIIKVKKINDQSMENVLYVIENSTNILHLRFEEVIFTKNAATNLSNFLKQHQKLESIGLIQVRFEDLGDHKKVLESISKNIKLKSLLLQQNVYYDASLTDSFRGLIQNGKHFRELDFSWCDFRNRMLFYALIDSLEKKPRVFNFKLRGFQLGKVEGKIMERFVAECKTMHTLDISHSYGAAEHFEFLANFGQFCFIKVFTMDGLETDLSFHLPHFGKALGENLRLEQLNMRDTKAKAPAQIDFWRYLKTNRNLKIINMERNRITDKVVAVIAEYIQQEGIALQELNLGRNLISGRGIKEFAFALSKNKSLKKLILNNNELEEENLEYLAASLSQNQNLEEINLSGNIINNAGVMKLAEFLPSNTTLRTLDLARNQIGSAGLQTLAQKLRHNGGLTLISLQRNRDIDEDLDGFIELAECLKENSFLQTIDLSGIKIKSTQLKRNFLPALHHNIFLQKLLGKISPGIINDELQDNITIESDIIGCLVKQPINNSFYLGLKNKRPELLKPALKLIRCQCIEHADFTNMSLTDEQMKLISGFLQENPPLKKLVLSQNVFVTDYGMILMIEALRKNTNLQHLSIMQCTSLSNLTLETLHDLVKDQNMTLYKVDLDETDSRFDKVLARSVVKEALLNRAIQKFLKPAVRTVSKEQFTIDFEHDAVLAENFDSVIKVWRIMRPNYIEVCDQNLEDPHIVQLADLLLSHLPHMSAIILRRNRIGDVGAGALAKFIAKNEKWFNYMEISRNQITDKGAAQILEAMRKNTRIVTLLIDFGNPISHALARKLDKEVKANQHISSLIRSSLAPTSDTFGQLSIRDKGREFLRCSLKAAAELSIIYLELQDNLLTFAEAKKIARVLKDNAPLRVLNLSNNLLDGKSAVEISQALITNTNLLELNLSYNRIGDQGVARIVLPIAKQRLRALVNPENQKNTSIRIGKLSLQHNDHTEEALKHIYALLFADRQIVVEINNPKTNIKAGTQNSAKNQIQPQMMTATSSPNKSPTKKSLVPERPKGNPMGMGRFAKLLGVMSGGSIKNQSAAATDKVMKELLDSSITRLVTTRGGSAKKRRGTTMANNQSQSNLDDPEAKRNGDLIVPVPAEEEQHSSPKRSLMRKSTFTVGKFCCGAARAGQSKFFLVRFIKDLKSNKEDARMFKCNENILTNVESVSQRYISFGVYFSILFFYLTSLIIPMTEGDSCTNGHDVSVYFYYAIYAISSAVMELIFCIYLQRKVDDKEALRVNKFHLWKIVSGQLARMDFFTDVLFMMQMYSCKHFVILAVGISCLVFSSAYQVVMLVKLLRKDDNQLIENIERNCKLSYISEHQALAVILDTFSLSNFESVGERTITIPKILSCIKSFVEDLPQFAMQVIYVLFLSDNGPSAQSSVVISILLGVFSFALSISHAFHAKASNVDIPRVEESIRKRIEEKHSEFQEKTNDEAKKLLDNLRQQQLDLVQEQSKKLVIAEPISFIPRLQQAEAGKSYLVNGVPTKAGEHQVMGTKGTRSVSGPMIRNFDSEASIATSGGRLLEAGPSTSGLTALRTGAALKDISGQSHKGKQITILNAITNPKGLLQVPTSQSALGASIKKKL